MIISAKFLGYFLLTSLGPIYITSLYGESPRASHGGPVLYIVNNTRSKIYAREIPTQDYGKKVPVVYITPTQFNPLDPKTSQFHDFYSNQWFGNPSEASGNIKLVSDDPADPNRWDKALELKMQEGGIANQVFKPNEERDIANKKNTTLEIRSKIGWNGNGWKIILDEKEVPLK